MAANTTKSLSEKGKTEKEYQSEMDLTAQMFAQEKKEKFSIPQMLEKSLGTELFISVNGGYVVVPVDGEEYEIPETLAAHGRAVIKNLK